MRKRLWDAVFAVWLRLEMPDSPLVIVPRNKSSTPAATSGSGSDSRIDTTSTNRADLSQAVLSQRPERARSEAPTSRAFRRTRQSLGTHERRAQSRPIQQETVLLDFVPRPGCNP
jgi:hypothetical protein